MKRIIDDILKGSKFYETRIRALIIFSTLILVFLFSYITWIRTLELKTIDWRFEVRGEIVVKEPIVIIAIDDNSIEELGNWPWPRTVHIKLINKLRKFGAKVIAFDVYFDTVGKKEEDIAFMGL